MSPAMKEMVQVVALSANNSMAFLKIISDFAAFAEIKILEIY